MLLLENFLSQIKSVFVNGVLGLSLGELGFILIAFIFAVFIAILVMYVFYSKRSNK